MTVKGVDAVRQVVFELAKMFIESDAEQRRHLGCGDDLIVFFLQDFRAVDKGDNVVDMVVAEQQASLLTICENGFGKRTELDDYRPQHRGGIGLINIKTSERNGNVVAIKTVKDDDDIMIITAKGIIIRTGLNELREIGRNTQGVRLIKLDTDDKVVAVERVVKEEKDESGETAAADKGEQPTQSEETRPPEADKNEHE